MNTDDHDLSANPETLAQRQESDFKGKDKVNTPESAENGSNRPALTLDEAIRTNSADYKLVEREKNVAIYAGRGGYEVWIVRVRKAEIYHGHSYPDREVPPSNEQWGTYGWTYTAASHNDPLRWAKARKRACLEYPGVHINGSDLKRFLE